MGIEFWLGTKKCSNYSSILITMHRILSICETVHCFKYLSAVEIELEVVCNLEITDLYTQMFLHTASLSVFKYSVMLHFYSTLYVRLTFVKRKWKCIIQLFSGLVVIFCGYRSVIYFNIDSICENLIIWGLCCSTGMYFLFYLLFLLWFVFFADSSNWCF